MQQYKDLLEDILRNGVEKGDRTGTGTVSVFGRQMRFNLEHGFPLVTLKKTWIKGVITELLWFLRGETNINFLHEHDNHIWDDWADERGELGPVYGKQWRDFGGVDQIERCIDQLKNNPDSRRIITSAWNVGELDEMALMPCHLMFQFWSRPLGTKERMIKANDNGYIETYQDFLEDYVGVDTNGGSYVQAINQNIDTVSEALDYLEVPKRGLSLQMYQRSCDYLIGVPFNIASYSLLLMMFAQVTDHIAEEFIWTGGDVHIYSNHLEGAKEMLDRNPLPPPLVKINSKVRNINDFKPEDFELINYQYHPTIKLPIAV